MNDTRTLHLIPVSLGDAPVSRWLPADVQALAGQLSTYIAENAKTARAFLKQIGTERALQEITIHTLAKNTSADEIRQWLKAIPAGGQVGLVSEAGCPAVADPGAQVVALAHSLGIRVAPWTGPSSILLALMGSGLDGQRFAFHGYAPVDAAQRAKQFRQWEQESQKLHQTQMLIETPYRNNAMYETLTQTLKGSTRLCIARSVTTDQEWIKTRTIADWKSSTPPDLNRQPTLFLFLA